MLNMLGSISDYNTPMEVHLEKIYQYGAVWGVSE